MPETLFETVKIPKDRVGALIGPKGKTKRKIEQLSQTAIEVDSKTGSIEIEGKGNTANFHDAVNAVKAIGRGFSPENALTLFDEETILEIIKIPEIIGKGEKSLKTKKGRVIGKAGMAREAIEKATNTKISVQGKTIAIIGKPEEVETARKATEMLLQGARHKTVTGFLQREERPREKFTI